MKRYFFVVLALALLFSVSCKENQSIPIIEGAVTFSVTLCHVDYEEVIKKIEFYINGSLKESKDYSASPEDFVVFVDVYGASGSDLRKPRTYMIKMISTTKQNQEYLVEYDYTVSTGTESKGGKEGNEKVRMSNGSSWTYTVDPSQHL